jgi:hypothetical protein
MPCRVEPSYDELPTNTLHLRSQLDKLTAENDLLRETLLSVVESPTYTIPAKVLKLIEKDQVKHRKEDLIRLEKTFRDQIAATNDHARERILYELLGRVVVAVPSKPLEPQLGFDPDKY